MRSKKRRCIDVGCTCTFEEWDLCKKWRPVSDFEAEVAEKERISVLSNDKGLFMKPCEYRQLKSQILQIKTLSGTYRDRRRWARAHNALRCPACGQHASVEVFDESSFPHIAAKCMGCGDLLAQENLV